MAGKFQGMKVRNYREPAGNFLNRMFVEQFAQSYI